MNYLEILAYSYLALLGAFLLILLFNSYYIKFIYVYFKKIKTPQKANIFYKYIVLIPARNESKVIRNILKSLINEDIPTDKKIFVCEVCGFVYIGNEKPEICPVCKVPNFKLVEVVK